MTSPFKSVLKPLNNLVRHFVDELSTVIHDGGILIFCIFVPFAYPLLYGYIYTNEVPRDIPIVVVDQNNSPDSRKFIRLIDAMPETHVVAHCTTMEEAKEYMMKRESFAVLQIPKEFGRRLYIGDPATVGLYCDMSSLLYYKNILIAVKNSSLQTNREIKVEKYMTATTREQEKITKMPVEYSYVPLFNKQSGFAAFLIPPVLTLIIQQTLLLGIGMSCGSHRERRLVLPNGKMAALPNSHRTRESAHPKQKKSQHSWEKGRPSLGNGRRTWGEAINTVIGRACIYFILYLIWAVYMYTYITHLFSLPQQSTFIEILGFYTPYLLACIMLGETLGQLIYRREDTILLFVCISVPMVFLSGISWPLFNMPAVWKYFAYLFPCRFGMHAYMKLTVMGAPFADIKPEYMALWGQVAVYFLSAVFLARRKDAA